jgi:hypothetical protein
VVPIFVSWSVKNYHHSDGGECDNDKRYPKLLVGGQPVFAAIWAFDGVGRFWHGCFLLKRGWW